LGYSEIGRVSLIQAQGQKGNYCALSYCWGSDTQHLVKTTRSSLASHLNGINIERLPKTYRDAIVVTRALGFRYLWIDALCIVQDDTNDWNKESSRMADVYQKASLVIAASGASNPDEGCFSHLQRRTDSVAIPHYDSFGCRNGSIWVAMATPGDWSPYWGPLNKRAWALQEWRLARRTLHFMPSGLSWKCRTGEAALGERYPMDIQQYPSWDWVISEFSGRELTFHKDRLAALEGLASAICDATGDKYIFGVFESGLPGQLLWTASDLEKAGENLVGVPSWSWAAKGGARMVWGREAILHTPVVNKWDIAIEEAGTLKVRGPVAECRTDGVIESDSEYGEDSESENGEEVDESGYEEGSERGRDAEWSKIAGLAEMLRMFRYNAGPLERIVSSYRERRTLGVAALDFEGAAVSHLTILAMSDWGELNK
jgi:hypothetical protein